MLSHDAVRRELLGHIPADAADFEEMVRACAGLADEISARGKRFVDQAALQFDDLVRDCVDGDGPSDEPRDWMGPDEAVEGEARGGADINNGGLAAQIACIVAGNGLGEGARMVREAAGLPDARLEMVEE